jgi:hypothetical protein
MKQFKKHLTLHLYRKDEVLAAMRWSIINKNISESVYWAIELFDSDMEEDALEMLQFIWITEIGFSSFTFFTRILDIYKIGELDRDTWISLINTLSRTKSRDSTILYILIRGLTTETEWTPRFTHDQKYTTIQQGVEDTLSRGKLLEAWLLSRALRSDEQWIILESLATQRGRQKSLLEIKESSLSDTLKRATVFALVSLDDTQWQEVIKPLNDYEIPSELQEAIDEWDAEESLRRRRVYSIKPEALLCLTERSEQSSLESSEYEIQDGLLESLLESPYWAAILDDYMDKDNGEWKSDTYMEMFYYTYFPCDIPDEWSSQDREKSHGRGLGRTSDAGLKRFLDSLFQRSKSIKIWNCIKPVQYMNSLDWNTEYTNIHMICKETLEAKIPFNPIVKKFEIHYDLVINNLESISIC